MVKQNYILTFNNKMALTKITVSGVPHFCGDWNTTKAATGYKIYAIVCNEGSCFCSNVSDNKVEPKILSYDSETGEYTCSAGWNLVAIGVGQEYITEITTLEGLVTTLSGDVNNINDVIPTSASSSNKLVDKSYVDSAISTSSAVFRGTSEPGLTTEGQFLTWANTLQHDLNDYVYWNTIDSNGNTVYKRYKYNGSIWVYEYDLNNSSFSAEEWEAIQSGITDELVTKLRALPSNVELTSIFNTKQNVIQDLSVIRSGAAAGATAYQLPDNGIPKADLSSIVQTSLNKADSAYQKPQSGIPKSDLTSGVQASLDKADSAYQKANTGIPKTDLSSTVQSSLDKADSALQQHQDITGKADKDTDATPGNVAKFDENGNPVDSGLSSDNIARKDGSYDTMSVGLAKNLEGRTNVTDSFFERTTGGDAEVANGLAQMTEVGGNSVKFNQLVQNGDFSNGTTGWYSRQSGGLVVNNGVASFIKKVNTYNNVFSVPVTVVNGHKYYFGIYGKFNNALSFRFSSTQDGGTPAMYIADISSTTGFERIANIVTASDNYTHISNGGSAFSDIATDGTIAELYNVQLIDLTAIFGSGNEPETVEDFEAWLASNIGKRAYYPHTEPTVLNVNMAGIETVGRNLLDPTTGKARIIGAYSDVYGNYYGISGTHGAITFTSDMGETSTITPDEDGKFLLEEPGELTVSDAGADCCVFLWWDGTQTDYVAHKDEKTYLDATHIYGKLNGTGELVRVWPTGMPKVNDLKDTLRIEDGQVVARRVLGEVDLGTLTWSYLAARMFFSGGQIDGIANTNGWAKPNSMICARYRNTYPNDVYDENSTTNDKTISGHPSQNIVWLRDSAYTDAATLKAAMSGVLLYFELATPKVYTDLVYQGSEYFDDGTPVTLPLNYNADNWGIERVLPLNTSEALATAKPELTCKYSIDAVETLNTHADEIEDLYDKNEELDAKKPNKTGDYPGMAVGSAKVLEGTNSKVEDFVFTAPQCADGIAKLNEVRGKSLVWNQSYSSLTIPFLGNGISKQSQSDTEIIAVTSTASQNYWSLYNTSYRVVPGHKYFFASTVKFESEERSSDNIYYKIGNKNSETKKKQVNNNEVVRYGVILSPESNDAVDVAIYGGRTSGVSGEKYTITNIICIDLTLMFGAGYEPTTVEEFEALYPLPYYADNDGEIISNKTEAVDVVGRNQWDEEWESGSYSPSTGAKLSNDSYIRSKNFIKVFPGATYCFHRPSNSYTGGNILYYDANYGFVDYFNFSADSILTVPNNVYYVAFCGAGTTYSNDICINLSDPSFNGQYEPYKKTTVELNLTTLTGKLNGEGESVVVFPEGMLGKGSTYDEAHGSVGLKRLGIRAYQSGDESDATVMTDGTNTVYQLATPEEYVLDTPIPETFQAYKGGTLKQLPENGSESTTAPCVISVTYALDAVGILTGLPQNYVSKESLQAMLTAMQSAGLFASYTMTYNVTTGKYEFTFTANS